MKKIELGDAISLIANVGVIAGLVFLALEVQQTRDAVLGGTYMDRASAQEEWGKWVADSDHVVFAVARWGESDDFSALSQEDQARLMSAVEAAFHRMDAIFYQYQLGLLPDEYYETTFQRLMDVWVPRWQQSGFLARGWIVPRPTFQAEIDRHLHARLQVH